MGTPGHMAHPFDVARVQTGLDLIKYFELFSFLIINTATTRDNIPKAKAAIIKYVKPISILIII